SRAFELFDPHRVGFPIAARPFSEAPAVDGGDAHHASLGTSGADFYAWFAVGPGSDLCRIHARNSVCIFERIFRLPYRHDGSDWQVGFEAAGYLQEAVAASGMGSARRVYMANQLYPQQH